MGSRAHVAFLTTVLPSGRRTGGELASQAIVDAVRAAGHDVTVVGYARRGAAARPGELAVGTRSIETDRATARERLTWAATALRSRLPWSMAKYASAAYRRAAADVVADADVVVVDHVQAGWWWVDDSLRRPMVLVAHNVEADIYRDQAASSTGARRVAFEREHRLVAEAEGALARRAAQVWAFTPEDAAHFGGRLLPLPSALEEPSAPEVAPTRDVAVLGTWTWEPNATGLRWFVDEVVPHLHTRDVHVAGAGGEDVVGGAVTHHGVVPDAARFLDDARVVAIPSRAGRGVQVKTIDALARGAWVVATSVALRGLDIAPPLVRCADEPATFAREIEDLLTTVHGRNDAAREWARTRRDTFSAAVRDALNELLEHRDERGGVRG